jgi:hypothetical protein
VAGRERGRGLIGYGIFCDGLGAVALGVRGRTGSRRRCQSSDNNGATGAVMLGCVAWLT